jgi:hypothetical protein
VLKITENSQYKWLLVSSNYYFNLGYKYCLSFYSDQSGLSYCSPAVNQRTPHGSTSGISEDPTVKAKQDKKYIYSGQRLARLGGRERRWEVSHWLCVGGGVASLLASTSKRTARMEKRRCVSLQQQSRRHGEGGCLLPNLQQQHPPSTTRATRSRELELQKHHDFMRKRQNACCTKHS